MSKAIQGAAMLAGAVGMGAAAFFDPALVASPFYDKLMASLALGGISMEAGAIASALTQNRGANITIRQPAAFRQIVYGERRVGGVMVYVSTTGSHHDQYNVVIVLAGHEIDSITGMYIDGRKVYWLGSGGGYSVRNGVGFGGIADSNDYVGPGGQTYNFGGTGHSGIYVEARYGDQLPGDVIAALTANDPAWAADGRGNSPYGGKCAYVYVKLEYNETLFPGGPAQAELKFTVRGKNDIWDPRTSSSGYSCNPALISADILENTDYGVGDIGQVNEDQLIAAANVCDEQVALAIGGTESRYCAHWNYDASVPPGDALAKIMVGMGGRLSRIGGEWYIWPAYWQGPSLDFDESILTGDLTWLPYRKFRDLCNRVTGTYIAPNVPYNVAGNLYDANGWFDGSIANQFPYGYQPTSFPQYAQDVLRGYSEDVFLEEDSGVLGDWDSTVTYSTDDAVTESGVIYRSLIDGNVDNDPINSFPLAYAAGTTYATGDYVVSASIIYKSLVDGNVGNTPASSPTDWVAAPASWVKWSNQLPMELTLDCVLSISQAQRLAKIALLRNRQQGSGTMPMHFRAWETQPLSVLTFSFAPNGWGGKILEVVNTRLSFEKSDDAVTIRYEADVQEADAKVYDWSTSEELTAYDVPSNPTLAPLTIEAPSGLTLLSDASTAILGADGINHPRILATWTLAPDSRVTGTQVQYAVHGSGNWIDAGNVLPATLQDYITGVIAGTAYDVRIQSLSSSKGTTSGWVEVDNVTAVAPNSLQTTYSNNPAISLSQPTSTTIAVAATAVTFGSSTVNYAARTLTISAPGSPTWYYVTIADPTQAGESGSPTLTATASTSTSLVGVVGHTYMGAVMALPAGTAVSELAGGWPSPQTVQVG